MSAANQSTLLSRFLAWRAKNIPKRQFILILSVIIGFLTGLASVTLKNTTHFIQEQIQHGVFTEYFNPYYFAFPILGIMITVFVKKYILRDKVKEPIPSTLLAISRKNGLISYKRMYSYMVSSIFTVGFGGSAGLEGPGVGTGSAIGANIGRMVHLNYKSRLLLICCASSAAIASMFNAPIAGIIFTIEIFSLDLTFSSLIPLLLSSASGAVTSLFLEGNDYLLRFKSIESFEVHDVPFYLLLGVLTALTSVYFNNVFFWVERKFSRFENFRYRMLIGGVLLGCLILLVPPLYGEGYSTIKHLLDDDLNAIVADSLFAGFLVEQPWMILSLLCGLVLLKAFATSLTISGGGAGGVFAPSLFTGATLGYVFSASLNTLPFFSIPISNFVLVGMAGLMAGVLHAPFTAVFMIAEITGGYELIVPLMMVSAISFLVARGIKPHSIYTEQLAKRGDLLTHNKDQVVLTLLQMEDVIETNFKSVKPDMSLGELVKVISQSNRNLFPVVNDDQELVGVLTLDDIRHLMFDQELYPKTHVRELMNPPPEILNRGESMEEVMKKFTKSGAWNLPVVDEGIYMGFISKSKMFSVYRNKLLEFSD